MLQELHNKICSRILANISEIQTCCSYPRMRNEIIAPACFVEIESFDAGTNPGTEELALIANFEALLVIDKTIENAEFAIRELTLKLANLINNNIFSSQISPAKIKDIEPDAFKPDLDAYLVWRIAWTHELHVGENIWCAEAVPPHTIFVNGDPNEV